jgi:hypothetical protein
MARANNSAVSLRNKRRFAPPQALPDIPQNRPGSWAIDIQRRIDRQEPATARKARDDLIHFIGKTWKRLERARAGPRLSALPSSMKTLGIFVFELNQERVI